jgi:hypothetical protein
MRILIQATPTPWYQEPITVATWVIAVATVGYFATTVALLSLTRRMFQASHRPYIGASSVMMTKIATPPSILFELPVRNFGSLPALNFTQDIQIIADGTVIPSDIQEEMLVTVVMPDAPYRASVTIDDPYEYRLVDAARTLSVRITCRYQGVQHKRYCTETKLTYDHKNERFFIIKGSAT